MPPVRIVTRATGAARDAIDIHNPAMAHGTADTGLELMAAPLELHFPEPDGETAAPERLGPGPAVKIDIAITEAPGFLLDACPAGTDRLPAHPVCGVRHIAARGAPIAVGSRTIIAATMPDLYEERGRVTRTGDISGADLPAVRGGGKCDEG